MRNLFKNVTWLWFLLGACLVLCLSCGGSPKPTQGETQQADQSEKQTPEENQTGYPSFEDVKFDLSGLAQCWQRHNVTSVWMAPFEENFRYIFYQDAESYINRTRTKITTGGAGLKAGFKPIGLDGTPTIASPGDGAVKVLVSVQTNGDGKGNVLVFDFEPWVYRDGVIVSPDTYPISIKVDWPAEYKVEHEFVQNNSASIQDFIKQNEKDLVCDTGEAREFMDQYMRRMDRTKSGSYPVRYFCIPSKDSESQTTWIWGSAQIDYNGKLNMMTYSQPPDVDDIIILIKKQ